MKRLFLSYILYVAVAFGCAAVMPSEVRWHNEAADTTRITEILTEAAALDARSPQARVGAVARKFIGTPYVASTLECTPEQLTVNIDELDCTTFVETVAALCVTVGERRSSWRDFIHNLENMRYRQGQLNGYASRLHYISDWIVDNSHRGNLEEVTDRITDSSYEVKTLDYMSSHRDSYPALKDDGEFNRMKSVEVGYRSHRFPYLKPSKLLSKQVVAKLRDGDIVAFTTKTPGLDVCHLGFIVFDGSEVKLLHASQRDGKVEIDPLPLADYLHRNRNITGARILRLKER
jgi:Protein of unknown function (DUF1460).